MKEIKLYNVIFPIWFILFFPPVVVITLIGNFLIDSAVVIICYFALKMRDRQIELKSFYRKSIIKVWLFGFLADIIGAAILFIIGILGDAFNLPYNFISAIDFNPYTHAGAAAVVILAMLISAFFIFLFNYKFTYKKQIEDKMLRIYTALTLAVVTMPWTFLIPTKWFYKGF